MEPLDPKAELMRLADEYAGWLAADTHYSTEHRRYRKDETRTALSAAISQALADARAAGTSTLVSQSNAVMFGEDGVVMEGRELQLAYNAGFEAGKAEKISTMGAYKKGYEAATQALADARRLALEEAFAAVTKWIKPGELQGNGCDDTAQRNGMILAANLLGKLLDGKAGGT